MASLNIRLFDGTARDAQGIIKVDGATFGDCHYAPEYIVALEADPRQWAWVAEEEGQIVGFVSAFPTHNLAGSRWEVDELAVRPASRGRGVGTRLVGRAISEGGQVLDLPQARALVASDNLPSQRVFVKNGFASVARVDLLLYEVSGLVPRPQRPDVPSVRIAQTADAPIICGLLGCPVARIIELLRRADNLYLIAESGPNAYGYLELIQVRTLQYEGFWIESMAVAGRSRSVASALFSATVEEAKRRESIDEVGYLASPENRVLYAACVGEGFKKMKEYQIFTRELNAG